MLGKSFPSSSPLCQLVALRLWNPAHAFFLFFFFISFVLLPFRWDCDGLLRSHSGSDSPHLTSHQVQVQHRLFLEGLKSTKKPAFVSDEDLLNPGPNTFTANTFSSSSWHLCSRYQTEVMFRWSQGSPFTPAWGFKQLICFH